MPHNGAEFWTTGLGLPVRERWRPWTLDGGMRMGGYVTRYATPRAFDFLSVRGSGHMVPQMHPLEGLEMITRWLRHEDWRPYVAHDIPPINATRGVAIDTAAAAASAEEERRELLARDLARAEFEAARWERRRAELQRMVGGDK